GSAGATKPAIVLRSNAGTVRMAETYHGLPKLRRYSSVDFARSSDEPAVPPLPYRSAACGPVRGTVPCRARGTVPAEPAGPSLPARGTANTPSRDNPNEPSTCGNSAQIGHRAQRSRNLATDRELLTRFLLSRVSHVRYPHLPSVTNGFRRRTPATTEGEKRTCVNVLWWWDSWR